MEEKISALKSIINNSENIVFFGGAGVSTESGIPDFRSVDGLYNQKYKYPPEKILSHTFFRTHTEKFYDFYREKMIFLNAVPNAAHEKLAELEKEGKVKAVITQNIDGLHTMAGSKVVHELHGSVHRNFCENCRKEYDVHRILESEGIPRCTCGGIIKPDVTLYEEALNSDVLENAVDAISNADVLIVGGTSLNVYPAAGLLEYYNGDKLILINKTKLPGEEGAVLVIHGSIGAVFGRI